MNPVLQFIEGTNQRDIAAIEAAFHPDFEMIVPQHPGRGFKGRDQEVKNMRYLIETRPDARVEIRRMAENGNEVWVYNHMIAEGLEMAAIVIFDIDPATNTIIRGIYFSDEVDQKSPAIDDWMQALGSENR